MTLPNRKFSEPIPIKSLTPIEMKARRDKGLCYNCDEIYTFGHKCSKLFMLWGEEKEEEVGEEEAREPMEERVGKEEEKFTISHHALTRSMGIQTIKLKGG